MEVLWNMIKYSISLMKCSLTSFTLNLMTLLWKHDFLWLLNLLVHSFNRHLFRVYYVPNTADCLPSYIFRCGVWVGIDGSKFFSVGQKLGVFFKWARQRGSPPRGHPCDLCQWSPRRLQGEEGSAGPLSCPWTVLPGTKGVSAWGQPVTACPGDLAEAAAQAQPAPCSPSSTEKALGSVANSLTVASSLCGLSFPVSLYLEPRTF